MPSQTLRASSPKGGATGVSVKSILDEKVFYFGNDSALLFRADTA